MDTGSTEHKAPWSRLTNTPRVFTPEDKASQRPNPDTPDSFAGMDLRAEPIVITVSAMPAERYFPVQLSDACTHNCAQIRSRTTGNAGGHFLITGPGWNGRKTKGVTKVFPCETFFTWGLIRTQLFQPDDPGKVKEIQTAAKVTSGQVFGTREFLKNNCLYRMTGAVLGIYGNSREEAIYPTYFTDANGAKLNGTGGRYTLRCAPGHLPPVNSFWALTLFELPSSLLSANSLNRHLINFPHAARFCQGRRWRHHSAHSARITRKEPRSKLAFPGGLQLPALFRNVTHSAALWKERLHEGILEGVDILEVVDAVAGAFAENAGIDEIEDHFADVAGCLHTPCLEDGRHHGAILPDRIFPQSLAQLRTAHMASHLDLPLLKRPDGEIERIAQEGISIGRVPGVAYGGLLHCLIKLGFAHHVTD